MTVAIVATHEEEASGWRSIEAACEIIMGVESTVFEGIDIGITTTLRA